MSDSIRLEFEGRVVGWLTREHFTYETAWIEKGFPLSHSLPLTETRFGKPALNWFANLLPEGATRERIARNLRLRVDDDFQLLAALGRECAGAFVLLGDENEAVEKSGYRTLLPEELESLGHSTGHLQVLQAEGRLSLAGAQDKLPVRLGKDGAVLLPVGHAPSSHILKLPNRDFGAIVENELFCLKLAAALDLPVVAAKSILLHDRRALLVERYDRVVVSDARMDGLPGLRRLHQEDVTQALGLSRHAKYQEDEGASLPQLAELIRASSQRPALELRSILRWLLFNAALGNRDNHSKNLSRLHGAVRGERWVLAPFYDLVNTTSYSRLSTKFSFFLGGAERLEEMRAEHWKAVARELGVAPALVFREAQRTHEEIATQLPTVFQQTAEELGDSARLVSIQRAIRKTNRAFIASLK